MRIELEQLMRDFTAVLVGFYVCMHLNLYGTWFFFPEPLN